MSSILKFKYLSVIVLSMFLSFAARAELVPVRAAADSDGAGKFDTWLITGPEGGDVRVVTIDPRDKNRLYISTLDGQIYTSADAGVNWKLVVNLNEPQLILDNLMVDSQDSKILYASGHRHQQPGGFFRSIDGGQTWKESKELHMESVHALTQSQFDPNVLTAGTTRGAWLSRNKGETWEKITSSTMPVNIDSLVFDPRNTSTIYAGTWWRPYKSTDSGKTWRLIKDGMIDDSDVFAITVDPRDPTHLVASACSGIYESYNSGEKWAKIQGIPSQSRRTRDIVQHPSQPGTVFAGTTEGFWMTANGGKSWAMTTSRNLEINSIAVHPDAPNRVYIATNNYGVMISNDGGRNFAPSNNSFSSRLTYSVQVDSQQSNRIYAATQNTATGGGFLFISNDGGQNWTSSKSIELNRIQPFAILQDRKMPTTLYLGTNQGVMRSIDRGITWSAIAASKTVPTRRAPVKRAASRRSAVKPAATTTLAGAKLVPSLTQKVRTLIYTADGRDGILAGTDSGIYRSYDLTKGWEKLDLGTGVDTAIFAIHTSPASPGTIWVGTGMSGVLVSRDEGKTWQKISGVSEKAPISSISTDPTDPNKVYVGTTQTFYVSKDGGATWRRRGGNLGLGNFTSILINPDNTDEIIISNAIETDGGIYISENGGDTWKRVDDKTLPLPSRRVWSIAFDPNNPNRIFAGTHSSGVYRIERRGSSSVVESIKDQKDPIGN